MKKAPVFLVTACLTALLTGCGAKNSDGVLARIVFDRGHGSMWGNQFYIEICEDEVICIRYFPEGSSEQMTDTEIPLTQEMWEQLVFAVGELKPELKPERGTLKKAQVLDGTEYRKLTLSWKNGGNEKTVNYSWPSSPAAQKLEALLEGLIPKKQPKDTTDIDGGVRHYENTNAPKTITSTQMRSFDLTFSAKTMFRTDTYLAGFAYRLEAAVTEDGVRGTYEKNNGCGEMQAFSFRTELSFMTQLQQIAAEYDFAQHNGIFYSVSGLPDFFGAKLNIQYASGETICASNNQSCFLPVSALELLEQLFQNNNN